GRGRTSNPGGTPDTPGGTPGILPSATGTGACDCSTARSTVHPILVVSKQKVSSKTGCRKHASAFYSLLRENHRFQSSSPPTGRSPNGPGSARAQACPRCSSPQS